MLPSPEGAFQRSHERIIIIIRLALASVFGPFGVHLHSSHSGAIQIAQ